MVKKKTFYRIREDRVATKEDSQKLAVRTFKLYRIQAADEEEASALWEEGKGESIARLWTFIHASADPDIGTPTRVRLHINYYQAPLRKKEIAEKVVNTLINHFMYADLYKKTEVLKPISEFRPYIEL